MYMPGLLGSISGEGDCRSVGDPDPDVFGPSGSGSGSGSFPFPHKGVERTEIMLAK